MLPEKEYYIPIQKFIEKQFNCIATGITKGNITTGQVDLIGAYEVGGEFLSDIEVVSIEVKTSTSSFGKSLGQILGYSVYGERCYLAIPFEEKETFTREQEYLANHLGVGLIRVPVDKHGKAKRTGIEITLTSKKHVPIPSQKRYLLHSIGMGVCALCNIYGKKDEMVYRSRITDRPDLFTNKNYKSIFLCETCFNNMVSEDEKNKFEIHKKSGLKAAKTKKHKKAAKKAVETRKTNRGEK